ncbi:hypothetical protein BH18ACT9_BH18ACT9_01300 [soil metagenome]
MADLCDQRRGFVPPRVAAVLRCSTASSAASLLGTGILAGFTTLSAYSDQTRALYTSGHETLALTYLLGTLGASLVVVHLADRLSEVTSRVEFEIEEGDL